MKKKLLIILFGNVFIFLLGLVSCEKCGPFPEKVKVVGFAFSTQSAFYDENSNQKLSLTEIINDTISYHSYAILINPRVVGIVHKDFKNSFDLINTAYACSPTIPKTDEIIQNILISSDQNFDQTHTSGTNLADLFDIVVNDKSNSIHHEKFKLTDYISRKPFVPRHMVLILNSPPDLDQDFEFTVKYQQSGIDVDSFEFKTEKVFIKRA